MLKKIVLSLFVLVALGAVPSSACSPNPFLMEDECYSSCANWALNYYSQCAADCDRYWSAPAVYNNCMSNCNNDKCNSLNECEDFCHEW